jgi:VWFA-related protein
VKFYTLDSRGLYTNNSFAGSSLDVSNWSGSSPAMDRQTLATAHENTDALSELAHETGGLFFENNNDLLKGIRRAFSDGRQYYTLAYVPANKNFDGKYRTIHVEVKGKGMIVTAKPGYWATN